MTDTNIIKPCKFCKSESVTCEFLDPMYRDSFYQVQCDDCCAGGPKIYVRINDTQQEKTEKHQKAIDLWNGKSFVKKLLGG